MNDFVDIFKKGDKMYYYNSLSENDRAKAWRSFQIWLRNPVWDGISKPLLKRKMFSDLVKSKYFFPVSDKNLILKIFQSLPQRNENEYFMMIRLSQNAKPLVWVLAQGGTGKIIRVRIGIELIPATKAWNSVVIYTVVMGEGRIVNQSTSLQVVMENLRDYYIKPKRTYAWPLLSNLVTIQPVKKEKEKEVIVVEQQI